MIFVIADSCRIQLAKLTQLLVSTFPGSTIYQHTELCRVPHDVLTNKADAVFLNAEMAKTNSLNFTKMLRRQNPNIPIFIISKTEYFREEADKSGASGYFVLPANEHLLLDAIRLFKNKECHHKRHHCI